MLKKAVLTIALATIWLISGAQRASWNTPGAGNPLLPGYFADPTIRKFGDTYYIYATTDGTGNGYGPPQVWMSKDFVNWRNLTMNWPTTEVVWAPDVVQQKDGSFRYYYCTPCEVRVGESDSPVGPWKNRLGSPDAVLVPDRFVHNAITLDPQLYVDDDGSEYLYFGTWGIYKGFGCGVARLSDDGLSFTDKRLIPNTEITDFFEAPFVFKRGGTYYFTYSSGSCHDDTYRVQYAVSNEGPMGPYTYKGCILKTNADSTVHGPGHHSILVDGDDYYIIYHRHNLPRSIHGFNRQVCIDKMEFDANGDIIPVMPTHDGVIPASVRDMHKTAPNLALMANVRASSEYSDWFKASYAVDDNNATLWRAKGCNEQAWIEVDMGKPLEFNEVLTQFEYATFFYQYKIEVSDDGMKWKMFADRTSNTIQCSPMVDKGHVKARFVRLTITDTQKNGHFPAIWNIKVFNAQDGNDPLDMMPSIETDEEALLAGYPWIHTKDVIPYLDRSPTGWVDNRVIDINADDYNPGELVGEVKNKGIPGLFHAKGSVPVVPKDGKMAFKFDGVSTLESSFPMPKTFIYNAPYTINAWVLNPEVSDMECVAQFMPNHNDLATIEFRNGTNPKEGIVAHNASFENSGAAHAVKAGDWQFWSVVYDGYMETVYCNGQKVAEKNIFIMLRPAVPVIIGNSFSGSNPFTGYLHSMEVYDKALDEHDIRVCLERRSDLTDAQKAALAKINHVAGKNFRIDAKQVSPYHYIANVVGGDGTELPHGTYDFSFGTDPKNLVAAGNGQIFTVDGDKPVIYARVSDLLGNTSPVISQKLRPSDDFKDLSGSLSVPLTCDRSLILESEGTNLNATNDPALPMAVAEVEGDFLLQCRVSNLSGLDRRSTPAYNEGGLVIRQELPDGRQNLIHLGVFPAYNCGNMLTFVFGHHRPQFKNNKGWSFDPWMQIERRNGRIYARTSSDGIHWTDMPASPVDERYQMPRIVKAGLYQTTYSDNHAFVEFEDIHLWVRQ